MLASKLTQKICDPSKAKEHYKKVTKSVAIKHPKTSSNLSKSIEQSNIITQELKTIEKTNTFHIQSVTIQKLLQNYQSP